jgi:hypothetical protein
MKKIIIALLVIALLAILCIVILGTGNTPAPQQNVEEQSQTAEEDQQQVVTEEVAATEWVSYTSPDYGLKMEYPSHWKFEGKEPPQTTYESLASFINPAYPGKMDTDVPSEGVRIIRADRPCEGAVFDIDGKVAMDSDWHESDFAPLLQERSICIETQDWPIRISATLVDPASKEAMDRMLSSLSF